MHAKNFATPHPQFAAQAEIENKTKGKTQKAWRKAGKKGLNQLVRVGMLSFVCMLLMCLNGAGIYAISKFRLQSTENFFGESAAQICHQGQKARQTATRVSKTNTYSKQNFFSNTKLHINMHVQRKGSFVQREVSGRSAEICNKRSQKPSQVPTE